MADAPYDLTKFAEPINRALKIAEQHIAPFAIRRTAEALATAKLKDANASADAQIILAQGDLRVAEIRARVDELNTRRILNRTSVAAKALQFLPNKISEQVPDEDWVYQFFNYCEDVGNGDMQGIWARLLAGEIGRPGSFSLRTLTIVKQLRREEAELFTRFCSLAWILEGRELIPIAGNLNDCGIPRSLDTEDLFEIQTMGLILVDLEGTQEITSKYKRTCGQEPHRLDYFGDRYKAFDSGGPGNLPVGICTFTPAGKELFPIAGAQPDVNYRDQVLGLWNGMGYRVEVE